MAAIDRLNTAVSDLQARLGEVSNGVNRALAEIDQLRNGSNPAVDAAAASVEGVNATLAAVRDQLNAAVPPA